jgi:hypothetical protein
VAVKLLFKCTHTCDIDIDKVQVPICWCGNRTVVRAFPMRAPRIVGHASGPLVEGKYLGATAVNLAEKGPLKLKPQDDEKKDAHAH